MAHKLWLGYSQLNVSVSGRHNVNKIQPTNAVLHLHHLPILHHQREPSPSANLPVVAFQFQSAIARQAAVIQWMELVT